MKKLSIVIPFYNEEPMCSLFFDELYKVLNKINNYEIEIVAVNDGSKDKTLEILKSEQQKHKEIRIVNFSRNFGHESAVDAGLHTATGDIIIPMDSDLQDPPEVIPQLIAKYEEGYDVVNAKRKTRKKDSFLKKFTAKMFYRLIYKWSGKIKVPQNVGHFRLVTRKVLDYVLALPEVNRVFRVEVPFAGFKTTEVEYERPAREKGETHYNYKSMIDLASDSITSTTVEPLRIITKLAISNGFLTFLSVLAEIVFFILYLCNIKLCFNDLILMGWLIINVLLIIATMILGSLAIMGEYQAKAFKENQHRPHYIIDEIIESEN